MVRVDTSSAIMSAGSWSELIILIIGAESTRKINIKCQRFMLRAVRLAHRFRRDKGPMLNNLDYRRNMISEML